MPSERWGVFPADEEPPRKIQMLAREVEDDGGTVLGLYREPVGQSWHIMALLPLAQVQATPYQRDLSPTHAKRLRDVIKKLDRFVDPIVVVRHAAGEYWTPNGNHRRDALQKLKASHVPVILIPDVMARVNPLTRARKTLPTFDQTWDKIQAALERFDVDKIRPEDVARAASPAAG